MKKVRLTVWYRKGLYSYEIDIKEKDYLFLLKSSPQNGRQVPERFVVHRRPYHFDFDPVPADSVFVRAVKETLKNARL